MRGALGSAAGIVMSTPEALRRLVRAFPELAARPITVGPVGWDRRDFEGDPPTRSDDAFRIVHTGYLHTELGRKQHRSARIHRLLRGSYAGVDILTRSHVYLVRALERVLDARPELRGRVELHLAGVQTTADREIAGAGVDVRLLGYLDHPEAVALMRSADLLFVPMHDLPAGTRAGIVPGKVYEYLASGRPILAAVPDGDARDILDDAGSAFLCRPADVDGIAAVLSERLDAYLASRPAPSPDPELVARYEYGRLAGDLAAFFEGVCAGGRAAVGAPV
jgi:glycosyltransferase involved in cell wall biosynthesis